ncbi:MAG: TPM domain-containing protein [Lachnospiraceae bacterium]|nr:TPM domain-containing protein [Lachnospiraceae bacterium]
MFKSMKKPLLLALTLMIIATFSIPMFAINANATGAPATTTAPASDATTATASTTANTTSGSLLLDDQAGLLTAEEAPKVLEALQVASSESHCNIVVLTTNTGLAEGSIESYARSYYKNNIENKSETNHTVTLTVDIQSRKVNVHGFNVDGSKQTINDNEATEIREDITDDLTAGLYEDAFTKFAKEASKIAGAIDENGNLMKSSFPWLKRTLISLVIGFVLALIICFIIKSQLTSVAMQSGAADYIRPNSLNITQSRDQFLYSTVTKTAKPKSSDSGGSSRGGGGGSSTGSF